MASWNERYRTDIITALLLASLLGVGSGCSDDDGAVADTNGASGAPRFAVAVRLPMEGGSIEGSSFVAFTEDLDSGELDLGSALEVSGAGGLWGVSGTGEFYVTSTENLTLKKFRFEDGGPVEVGRLGLGRELPFLFGELMVFDGPDRAYLFALSSGAALEINVEEMVIAGSLDVTSLLDPAQPTFLSVNNVIRDDEYVTVTYAIDLVGEATSELSQIVFFEPATGAFDLRTAPCGGLTFAMEADNGDLFFSSDPFVAGIHAIDESRAPAPCVVRVPAGSRDPDPNVILLNDLTGGPTGGLIPRGGSSVWVRTLDTEAFPLMADTTAAQLFVTPGWQTWEVDLGQPEEARVFDRAPIAGGISFFGVDGVFYENDSTFDLGMTTIVRTTGSGAPAPGLSTRGVPFSVVRLR